MKYTNTLYSILTTLVLLMIVSSASARPTPTSSLPITQYPVTLPTQCNDTTPKLYDECGDQVRILNDAIRTAKQKNKVVLVVYGGEWCVWCHVLNNHFEGKFRTRDYNWRVGDNNIAQWTARQHISKQELKKAQALNKYVSDKFVIAHLDSVYTNGNKALNTTGFDADSVYYFPYIVAVDKNGRYVDYIDVTDAMENIDTKDSSLRQFKGYNRKILLDQLRYLKNKTGG